MVNQLTISFERNRIILSPYDHVLYDQLIKYEVKKVNQYGEAIYSSEDEHFIDALGLAHLAFVLKFKQLTNTIKDTEVKAAMTYTPKAVGKAGVNKMFNEIQSSYSLNEEYHLDPELDGNKFIKRPVPSPCSGMRPNPNKRSYSNWGSRTVSRGGSYGRSMW